MATDGKSNEVSTGKTAKEYIGTTQVVRVDQLVTDKWTNPRQFMTDDHVKGIMDSLEENGQLQNINTTFVSVDENGRLTLAVCAGWTRTEAITRLVHLPLIRQYNKEKTPASPLVLSKPEDRATAAKAYPELYEKNAEKWKVLCLVRKEEDALTMQSVAYDENDARKNLSLYEDMCIIEAMAGQDIAANKIAQRTRKSTPQISQIRKCFRLINKIPEWLSTPDKWEVDKGYDDAEKAKQFEIATRLNAELVRRIKPFCDKDIAVTLSHLRELAGYLDRGDKGTDVPKLSRKLGMDSLAKLVGANHAKPDYEWLTKKDGESTTGPMVLGQFVSEMKVAQELTAAYRSGKGEGQAAATPTETGVETAAGTATESTVEGGKEVTVGTVAATAAATAAEGTPVSTGNTEAAVTPAVEASTAATEEANANVATAATPAVTSVGGIEITDDDEDEDLTEKTKGTSKAAPTDSVKIQAAELISNAEGHTAHLYSEFTQAPVEDQQTVIGLMTLACHAQLKSVLGKSKEYTSVYNKATEAAESLQAYIENLEKFKAEVVAKNPKIKFSFLAKPELPEIEGVGIDTSALTGELPTDDDIEDDDMEPSDEELAKLETK